MKKQKHKGIALFIAVLLTMSLASIALVSMSRISLMAKKTGKSLSDKKLLFYAQSAANLVTSTLQKNIDATPTPQFLYFINGINGPYSFKYYPVDVSSSSGKKPVFAYRAQARRFAGVGDMPPGFKPGMTLTANQICYNITIDVKEVLNVNGGNINAETATQTTSSNYYFGRTKSIGIITCFTKS